MSHRSQESNHESSEKPDAINTLQGTIKLTKKDVSFK